MSETTNITSVPTPESFSPANAVDALGDLFEQLSKKKKFEYLGHLNEIEIVIRRLAKMAGVNFWKSVD